MIKTGIKIEFLYKVENTLALFQLFFLYEEFQTLADNINKNTYILNPPQLKKGKGINIGKAFISK